MLAGVATLVVALLVGGWLWLRDSSLVAIRRVQVTGLKGAQAREIRAALTVAARGMTTLDVHVSRLEAAVSAYPIVRAVSVSTHFPHGVTIEVSEQIPVAVVMVGMRRVPVAANGFILRPVPGTGTLPVLHLAAAPGIRVTDPLALAQLNVLGAAPYPLLAHASSIANSGAHGVVVGLRRGPSLYFGAPTQLAAKWRAVMALLVQPDTAGAAYIDVTDPRRPAAGAGPGPGQSASSAIVGGPMVATPAVATTTPATSLPTPTSTTTTTTTTASTTPAAGATTTPSTAATTLATPATTPTTAPTTATAAPGPTHTATPATPASGTSTMPNAGQNGPR